MSGKRSKHHHLPPGVYAVQRKQKNGFVTLYYGEQDNGKRKYLGRTLEAALIRKKEVIDEIKTKKIYTLEDAIAEYARSEMQNLSVSTRKQYQSDEIQPIHSRQYTLWRKDAPIMCKHELNLLRHVFNLARYWGMTQSPNPLEGIPTSPRHHKKRQVLQKREDLLRLCEALPIPESDILKLTLASGQRINDILMITETNLYRLHDRPCMRITQKKTGKIEYIHIDDHMMDILCRMNQRRKTSYFCCDAKGEPISYIVFSGRVRKAARALGMDFQLRDLRAFTGTEIFLDHGIKAAQELLGHETEKTTSTHYIRAEQGQLV
jgi:integrase